MRNAALDKVLSAARRMIRNRWRLHRQTARAFSTRRGYLELPNVCVRVRVCLREGGVRHLGLGSKMKDLY